MIYDGLQVGTAEGFRNWTEARRFLLEGLDDDDLQDDEEDNGLQDGAEEPSQDGNGTDDDDDDNDGQTIGYEHPGDVSRAGPLFPWRPRGPPAPTSWR